MNSEIIIEKAKIENCGELARLKLSVWKTTYSEIYPIEKFENFNYFEQEKKFEKYVSDEEGAFFVAKEKESEKLIGYCYVGFSARAFKRGVPEIILLYVLKDFQGQGIGRKFFEISKDFLKRKGFDEFIISCNKYNKSAQLFYEKMGGEIIFVDDDDIDKSKPQIKFLFKI